MIKLIAIDLDGTLLNSQGLLSKENLQAIRQAEKQAVKIVLCTGRPYLAMKNFVEEIGFTHDEDYIITFNGGQTQRAATGEVLIVDTLSRDEMLVWSEEMSRLDLPMNVIDQDYVYEPLVYPGRFPSLYVRRGATAPVRTKDFMTFQDNHHFNKFVVGTEVDHLIEQQQKINKNLLSQYTLTMSYPWLMEISGLGVNKGKALKNLSLELNIDRQEVMAIGDQLNDLSMIEYAGLGVAMANAVDEVKLAADYMTKSNDDHGVAHAIYQVL